MVDFFWINMIHKQSCNKVPLIIKIFYKKIRIGILLITLRNLLYLAYIYFCRNEISDFGNFSSGLLQFNVNV